MFGPSGPNILSFVWISTLLLFYVESYLSLSFYPIDFKPYHNDPHVLGRCAMTFLSHTSYSSGFFFRIFLIIMWINVGTFMYLSAEAHEWILASQHRARCQRRHDQLAPSPFNQLKYRGLYPIIFQCGANIAEGCSALNQHWVFDMNSRTFKMLHFNIELTLVIASNTKRRRNVVLIFGQRHRQWYSIKPTRKSEFRNLKL